MATSPKIAGTKSVAKVPAKSNTAKPATAAKPATKPAVVKPATPAKAVPKKAVAKPAAKKTKTPAGAEADQRRYYVEVAAYYIAERRGFNGGGEFDDWVQAEAEIDRLLRDGLIGA